jgi:hypothetical protein
MLTSSIEHEICGMPNSEQERLESRPANKGMYNSIDNCCLFDGHTQLKRQLTPSGTLIQVVLAGYEVAKLKSLCA